MTTSQAFSTLRDLFGNVPGVSFRTRLWDGSEETIGSAPTFTLVFRDEATFTDLLRSQDAYKFGVAYTEDRFDIEGDFYAALRLKDVLKSNEPDAITKLKTLWHLGLHARHTRTEDQRNIQKHYDVSNDFYRLFLDTRVMAYSCAYFHNDHESLEDAQEHKVDLICRKLRLKPGEKFLDIGCGWGGLLIHAARNYGVTGHGVTLSQNQYDLARQRVKDAGLEDKITIELRDYRDLTDASFDKIASVGMYEHVGIARYTEYFGTAYRLLKNGGLFLNHGITTKKNMPFTGEAKFLFTYIFPNAELDDISHTQTVMEDTGFEIINMESLRLHYAKTLREWEKRLMGNIERALQIVPKDIVRAWRIYFASSALGFEDGRVSICQTLVSKSPKGEWDLPKTPHDVYSGS
jgi:cyclopropane-fatty-acyl-phospholipid synthase